MKLFLTKTGHDLGEHPTAQGNGLINFEHELVMLQPPKKLFWFSREKPSIGHQGFLDQSPSLQPASDQITPVPLQTCSSALKGFCPHYNPDSCNENYEMCIHYQATSQAKVLEHVKVHPDVPSFTPFHNLSKSAVSVSPQNLGSKRLTGRVFGSIHGSRFRVRRFLLVSILQYLMKKVSFVSPKPEKVILQPLFQDRMFAHVQ